MENSNKKIITVSLLVFSAIIGFTTHLLLVILGGSIGFFAGLADSQNSAVKLIGGGLSSLVRLTDTDLVRHGLPVAIGIGLYLFLQLNAGVLSWASDVVVEIRKVVWPSQKDTTAMTIAVVVMVAISSVIISLFDLFSGFFVNQIIN